MHYKSQVAVTSLNNAEEEMNFDRSTSRTKATFVSLDAVGIWE